MQAMPSTWATGRPLQARTGGRVGRGVGKGGEGGWVLVLEGESRRGRVGWGSVVSGQNAGLDGTLRSAGAGSAGGVMRSVAAAPRRQLSCPPAACARAQRSLGPLPPASLPPSPHPTPPAPPRALQPPTPGAPPTCKPCWSPTTPSTPQHGPRARPSFAARGLRRWGWAALPSSTLPLAAHRGGVGGEREGWRGGAEGC